MYLKDSAQNNAISGPNPEEMPRAVSPLVSGVSAVVAQLPGVSLGVQVGDVLRRAAPPARPAARAAGLARLPRPRGRRRDRPVRAADSATVLSNFVVT